MVLEKALGPEHPDIARILDNLGELYRSAGRSTEAEPLYRRALATLEKALGPEHPDVATVLNDLSKLYREQGRDREAEVLRQRASAIERRSSR